uniref:Uncharacterized protein n=1 Tax=Anguilla anguilla TaxID=7936 RepID=A0A0E9QTK6_ANGAN
MFPYASIVFFFCPSIKLDRLAEAPLVINAC